MDRGIVLALKIEGENVTFASEREIMEPRTLAKHDPNIVIGAWGFLTDKEFQLRSGFPPVSVRNGVVGVEVILMGVHCVTDPQFGGYLISSYFKKVARGVLRLEYYAQYNKYRGWTVRVELNHQNIWKIVEIISRRTFDLAVGVVYRRDGNEVSIYAHGWPVHFKMHIPRNSVQNMVGKWYQFNVPSNNVYVRYGEAEEVGNVFETRVILGIVQVELKCFKEPGQALLRTRHGELIHNTDEALIAEMEREGRSMMKLFVSLRPSKNERVELKKEELSTLFNPQFRFAMVVAANSKTVERFNEIKKKADYIYDVIRTARTRTDAVVAAFNEIDKQYLANRPTITSSGLCNNLREAIEETTRLQEYEITTYPAVFQFYNDAFNRAHGLLMENGMQMTAREVMRDIERNQTLFLRLFHFAACTRNGYFAANAVMPLRYR